MHWSVIQRHVNYRSEGLPRYDPPNLRVVLDDIKNKVMPVVSIEDEVNRGTPNAPIVPKATSVREKESSEIILT